MIRRQFDDANHLLSLSSRSSRFSIRIRNSCKLKVKFLVKKLSQCQLDLYLWQNQKILGRILETESARFVAEPEDSSEDLAASAISFSSESEERQNKARLVAPAAAEAAASYFRVV
ncbi:unnamed protein product [Amoebophrya sp. A25]|nr:unnamed protein product [Amoebophrya sp. A25]|eukprot:GSA25T00022454001.1